MVMEQVGAMAEDASLCCDGTDLKLRGTAIGRRGGQDQDQMSLTFQMLSTCLVPGSYGGCGL